MSDLGYPLFGFCQALGFCQELTMFYEVIINNIRHNEINYI